MVDRPDHVKKTETVVFTNGCFDLLHPGHVDLLERARALGTKLIVGLNSDSSVRAIKGKDRPLVPQDERKQVLMALRSVDEVIIFEELTPDKLIRHLNPDVLVKGGDWKVEEIVGSDFVLSNGGEVVSLPLVDGYSSTDLAQKIRAKQVSNNDGAASDRHQSIDEHIQVVERLASESFDLIRDIAELLKETFENGKKVLILGNGGSAADAQHIAAEFVGRYERERRALPAIALTTDTSALTAIPNDYEFERVFERQVDALANEGDCLIAISTSGNSPNVISAVMAARRRGCRVVGLTGAKGKRLAGLCDKVIMVPSERTSRIQEAHITIAHIWCELLDEWIDGPLLNLP